MHLSGWVHRDISSGNIIVYKGRGYLTDFEYAKETNFSESPDGQTVRRFLLDITIFF